MNNPHNLPDVTFHLDPAQSQILLQALQSGRLSSSDAVDLTDQMTVRFALCEYAKDFDEAELARFEPRANEIIASARDLGITAALAKLGLSVGESMELLKRAYAAARPDTTGDR